MATEKVSSPIQAASIDLPSVMPNVAQKHHPKTTESFSGPSRLTRVRRRDSAEITWNDMRVNGSLLPMRRLRLYAGLRRFRTVVGTFLSGR